MNRLSLKDRAKIINYLVEGNSMRAASRMADVSINTVTKLLVDVGYACAQFQDKALVNLRSRRIQCDEIWAFCYAKAKNAPADMKGKGLAGDIWTWTALDPDSRLMISWLVGDRDVRAATRFMNDVAKRLVNRVQLTTDGHKGHSDLSSLKSACTAVPYRRISAARNLTMLFSPLRQSVLQ